jgi:hypothetical protein
MRNLTISITTAVALLYGANAAVIFFAQPVNVQNGETVSMDTQYGTISVAIIKGLKSGGVGSLSSGTTGYVNVLAEEPTIYINGDAYDKAPERDSYIYRHELAHVLQKKLIAKRAGGYPSVWNPAVSFAYYKQLLDMNSVFEQSMPKGNSDAYRHSQFAGLETGADCFAQGNLPEGPLTYIGSDYCTPEQREIALSMLEERWPEPMTDEEKMAAKISMTGTAQMSESR